MRSTVKVPGIITNIPELLIIAQESSICHIVLFE